MNRIKNITRFIFAVSVISGLIFYKSPTRVNLEKSFYPAFQSFTMPLGSDRLGRNILSLYAYGAVATIILSIPARLLTILFSSIFSFIVFYFGKLGNGLLQPFSSVFISLPSLLIALLSIQLFGASVSVILISVILSDWALVYETLQNKIKEIESSGYVISSRCLGGGRTWIFKKHIIPGIYPVINLLFVTGIPSVIMTLSIFSFLGVDMGGSVFGPGLGEQIAFSKDYFSRSAASVIVPVIGILLMLYSFSKSVDVSKN